jgi:hypothetical protein
MAIQPTPPHLTTRGLISGVTSGVATRRLAAPGTRPGGVTAAVCCAPAIAFAAGDGVEDETHVHILANEPLLDAAAGLPRPETRAMVPSDRIIKLDPIVSLF